MFGPDRCTAVQGFWRPSGGARKQQTSQTFTTWLQFVNVVCALARLVERSTLFSSPCSCPTGYSRSSARGTRLWGAVSLSAASEAQSWSHPEQLGQISAHTSLLTVTAKNLHPLTITGVTGAPGPDKLLPGLVSSPCAFSLSPPTSLLLLSPALPVQGRRGLCDANWSVGFRGLGGRRHNHTLYQTEPTLTQLTTNSQLSLGTWRGYEIKPEVIIWYQL